MIILASASKTRLQLLRNAGVNPDVVHSPLDENTAKPSLLGLDPKSLAIKLAELKAQAVSSLKPSDLVIGADQTLAFQGHTYNKPSTMEEAFDQLATLQGHVHFLNSAVACVANGNTTFATCQTVKLTMRSLSQASINRYLDDVGTDILSCVGCYQIEGRGIQLFDAIEGDYFAIMGLPLLPLMGYLRSSGSMES